MADHERNRTRPARISVVIPVLNGATTLPFQLGALAAQKYDGDWEVVVADNGSTDGTADVSQSFADRLPALQVVDASAERGINAARNAGASAATGDFLLFCDADDQAAPGWLAAMAAAASDADLLGGRLDDVTLNDSVVLRWRPNTAEVGLPVALGFLPFAVGANLGVWADVIADVGGFDAAYRRGGTEVAFCWRAQLAGYRLAFVPDAVVRYRHRPGLRPLARQYFKYGMADAQLYRGFREHGITRDTGRQVLRAWRNIVANGIRVRDPQRRGEGLRMLAYRAGRLRGSVRQRVLFP